MQTETLKENKMGVMPVGKLLVNMALPMIISMLVQALYNIVDSVYVSQVSESAVTALSLAFPVQNMQIGFAVGVGVGVNSLLSQSLGRKEQETADWAAGQGIFLALVCTAIFMLFGFFGVRPYYEMQSSVRETVEGGIAYTSICCIFTVGVFTQVLSERLLQATGRAFQTMLIQLTGAVLNIILDPVFIFLLNMGVAGAAISTLVSRIFCAVVVLYQLRKDRQPIVVRDYLKIRPDGKMIGRILALGIPSGIENSMFQLGKLAIQSTVSTLGTTAIAAQAMTNMLEMLNGTAVIGVGIGLMTVVGQSLGAGRKDEAVYYMKKLMAFSEVFLIVCCAVVYALARPITMIGGMEAKSAEMCLDMMFWITIVKPIVWMFAFIPAYGMRAAGDVKFSMITSCITMWTFRFCLCVYLIRVCGMGPMAVWIGMFTDWTVRAIVFGLRFKSGKWMEHKVV